MVNLRKIKGYSSIEFVTLVILVLAIFIGFSGYVLRGFGGHWKAAGDTFGQGKQYDSRRFGAAGELGGTLDCFIDRAPSDITTNLWIDDACYRREGCDCTLVGYDGRKLAGYNELCEQCKNRCTDARCQP